MRNTESPSPFSDKLPRESATAVLDRPEGRPEEREKDSLPAAELRFLKKLEVSPGAVEEIEQAVGLDPEKPRFHARITAAERLAQATYSRADAGVINREAAGEERAEGKKSRALNLAGTVAKKSGEAIFRIAVAKLEMLYDTVGAAGSHFRNKDVLRRIDSLFSPEPAKAQAGVEQLLSLVEQQIVLREGDGQQSFTEIMRAAAQDPEKTLAVRQILLLTLLSSAEARIAQGAHHVGRHVIGGNETMSAAVLQARAQLEDFYHRHGVDFHNPVECHNFDASPEGKKAAKELVTLRRELETKLRTQGMSADFTGSTDVSVRQMARLYGAEMGRGAIAEMIRNPKEIARLVGAGVSWDHLTGLRQLNLGELINGQSFQENVLRQLAVYERIKGLSPAEQEKLPPALREQIQKLDQGSETPSRDDFKWKTSLWSYIPKQAKTMAYLGTRTLTWWAGLAMDQVRFLHRTLKEKGQEKDVQRSGVLEAMGSLFEGQLDPAQQLALKQETGLNMLTLGAGGLDAICDRLLEAVDRPGEMVGDKQREAVTRSFHGLEKFITRADVPEKDRTALLLRLKERKEEQKIAGLDLAEVADRLDLKIDLPSRGGLVGKVTGFFERFRGAGLLLKDWQRVLPKNLAYLTDRALFMGVGSFRGTLGVESAVNMAIGGATMAALSEIPGAGDYLAAAYGGVSAAAEMASHALSGSTYAGHLRGASLGVMETVGGKETAARANGIFDRLGFRGYEQARQEATGEVDPTAELPEREQQVLRQGVLDNLREYLPTGVGRLIDRFQGFRAGVRASNAQMEAIQHRFSEIIDGFSLAATCEANDGHRSKREADRQERAQTKMIDRMVERGGEQIYGHGQVRAGETLEAALGRVLRAQSPAARARVLAAAHVNEGNRTWFTEGTSEARIVVERGKFAGGDLRVHIFKDPHLSEPGRDNMIFDINSRAIQGATSRSARAAGEAESRSRATTRTKMPAGAERAGRASRAGDELGQARGETEAARATAGERMSPEQLRSFSRAASVDARETVWGGLEEVLGKGSRSRDVAAVLAWANYSGNAEVQRFLDQHRGGVKIEARPTAQGIQFTVSHDGRLLIFETRGTVSRDGSVQIEQPRTESLRVYRFTSSAPENVPGQAPQAPRVSATVPGVEVPPASTLPERIIPPPAPETRTWETATFMKTVQLKTEDRVWTGVQQLLGPNVRDADIMRLLAAADYGQDPAVTAFLNRHRGPVELRLTRGNDGVSLEVAHDGQKQTFALGSIDIPAGAAQGGESLARPEVAPNAPAPPPAPTPEDFRRAWPEAFARLRRERMAVNGNMITLAELQVENNPDGRFYQQLAQVEVGGEKLSDYQRLWLAQQKKSPTDVISESSRIENPNQARCASQVALDLRQLFGHEATLALGIELPNDEIADSNMYQAAILDSGGRAAASLEHYTRVERGTESIIPEIDSAWAALRTLLGADATDGKVLGVLREMGYESDPAVKAFLDKHRGKISAELKSTAEGARLVISHDGQQREFSVPQSFPDSRDRLVFSEQAALNGEAEFSEQYRREAAAFFAELDHVRPGTIGTQITAGTGYSREILEDWGHGGALNSHVYLPLGETTTEFTIEVGTEAKTFRQMLASRLNIDEKLLVSRGWAFGGLGIEIDGHLYQGDDFERNFPWEQPVKGGENIRVRDVNMLEYTYIGTLDRPMQQSSSGRVVRGFVSRGNLPVALLEPNQEILGQATRQQHEAMPYPLTGVHDVERGETLFGILNKHGVPSQYHELHRQALEVAGFRVGDRGERLSDLAVIPIFDATALAASREAVVAKYARLRNGEPQRVARVETPLVIPVSPQAIEAQQAQEAEASSRRQQEIEAARLAQVAEEQRQRDLQEAARRQAELEAIRVTRAEAAPVRGRPGEQILNPERATALATGLLPDYVRGTVSADTRESIPTREDWARTIVREMTTNEISVTPENIALIEAVIDRESSFRLEPRVDRANFMGKVAAKIDRKIEESRGMIIAGLMSLEAPGAAGDRTKEVGAGAANVVLGGIDWIGRTTGLGEVETRVSVDTNPQSTRDRAIARLDNEKAKVTNLTKMFVRDVVARLGLDLGNMTEKQLAEALRRPDAETIAMQVYDQSYLSQEYGNIIWAVSQATGKSFRDLMIEAMRGAVSTVGPMQLDIDRAAAIAQRETGRRLDTEADRLRLEEELYQLDGGLHYGIANLAPIFEAYRDLPMRERVACILADENAGVFSSRNAQVQTYCNDLAISLGLGNIAVDGDMLRYPARGIMTPVPEASRTQELIVQLNDRFGWGLEEEQIRADLEHEKALDFTQTRTYRAIIKQIGSGKPAGWQPQVAMVPDITITIGYQENGSPRTLNVQTHVARAAVEMTERLQGMRA